MFAKLLKAEFRATGMTMGWLSLAALGLGVLGTVILRILVTYGDAMSESDSILALAPLVLIMVLGILLLGLFGCAMGSSLFILYRFYQHKFTDEGYLTFTLPVNVHQLLLSSWLSILFWNTVTVVVTFGSIAMAILVGTASGELVNSEIIRAFSEMPEELVMALEEMLEELGPMFVFSLASMGIQLLASPVLSMTCIVLGSTVAKKHKLLASFAFYYGLEMVLSSLMSVLSAIVSVDSMISGSPETTIGAMFLIQPILFLLLAVAGYFLSVHLMGKKLNLP